MSESVTHENHVPPSLKPTRHFTDLEKKREVFGRLVQCRTGHSYTGEYYSKFVPSENIDCPCGERFQTREHILRECPKYEEFRHLLREESKDIHIPDILGTPEGIQALSKFLEKSGAFTKDGKPRRDRQPPTFKNEPTVNEDEDDDPLEDRREDDIQLGTTQRRERMDHGNEADRREHDPG